MARKRATLSDLLNDMTMKVIFDKFKMICVNMFEWEGLPDGIEERHLESMLFDYGKVIFFRDPVMSYMALPASQGTQMNVYGDPLTWWADGVGYHEEYSADECVIIRNNKLAIPTRDFVMFYAYKIAEAERTMDVNVKACKTPFIFTCDDKDVLTFKQIFSKIDGNVPAIFADRGLNLDSIQAIQTGVKFLGNDLTDYKNSVENEFLTFLGINNLPIDKKERTIVAEVESNDELVASFAEIMHESRNLAAEQIKALYGLPVKPCFRQKRKPTEGGANNAVDDTVNV